VFRVKICGITNVDDALAAARAGADAIGINCYVHSKRFCPLEEAKSIARAVPRQVCKVGVFVNASADEVRATVAAIGLDLAQLHGDETPELLAALRGLAVMKAFRLATDYAPVAEFLGECHRRACVPRMVLVDALRPGEYGGTGHALDWTALCSNRHHFAGAPLVLAGGLTPANVTQAIAAVRPWGVDTASGVEASPGRKSAALVSEFVSAAQTAFLQAGGWRLEAGDQQGE
jgi:phosphoribosylanthranilate isomerase